MRPGKAIEILKPIRRDGMEFEPRTILLLGCSLLARRSRESLLALHARIYHRPREQAFAISYAAAVQPGAWFRVAGAVVGTLASRASAPRRSREGLERPQVTAIVEGASERYEVRQMIVEGDRAAVQIEWSGTLAVAAGPLPAGHVMRAQICSIIELRDGKVWRQEQYDCFL